MERAIANQIAGTPPGSPLRVVNRTAADELQDRDDDDDFDNDFEGDAIDTGIGRSLQRLTASLRRTEMQELEIANATNRLNEELERATDERAGEGARTSPESLLRMVNHTAFDDIPERDRDVDLDAETFNARMENDVSDFNTFRDLDNIREMERRLAIVLLHERGQAVTERAIQDQMVAVATEWHRDEFRAAEFVAQPDRLVVPDRAPNQPATPQEPPADDAAIAALLDLDHDVTQDTQQDNWMRRGAVVDGLFRHERLQPAPEAERVVPRRFGRVFRTVFEDPDLEEATIDGWFMPAHQHVEPPGETRVWSRPWEELKQTLEAADDGARTPERSPPGSPNLGIGFGAGL